jgi:hypothetical protein
VGLIIEMILVSTMTTRVYGNWCEICHLLGIITGILILFRTSDSFFVDDSIVASN